MRFENGRLGAMILVLGIVLAILGSYVLSLDVQEHEVTKYEYVTDLTGLFETTQAPTYIDYNPSENYTGYYTSASRPYFDGVEYTEATRPNLYKLNLAPIDTVHGDTDLSSISADGLTFFYWTTNSSFSQDQDAKYMTIADLMTELNFTSYEVVEFLSKQTEYTGSGGFVTFAPKSYIDNVFHAISSEDTMAMKVPGLTGDLTINSLVGNTVPASDVPDPILACSYDIYQNSIQLFKDKAMTQSLGLFAPSDVYVVWSTSTSSGFHLDDMLETNAVDYPDPEYMDPSQGVKVN